MNYYRKTVDNVVDNVKLKMQMAAFTLKLIENKNNISSNLSKINTNASDISNSKTNISSNLSKINTNASDISSNLSKINTNTSDISSNLSKINTNTSDISSNLSKINTNESNISDNLSSINTNKNSITNLKYGYKLSEILVFSIINNVSKAMSQSNPSFVIFTETINTYIKKDSYIEFNLSIYMLFLLHYINAQFFYVLLKIFNKNNQLITSIRLPLIGMISKQGIVSNMCYLIMPNDYENIKIEMSIELKENQKRNDIIKILDFDNYIYIKIYEKLNNAIEFDV